MEYGYEAIEIHILYWRITPGEPMKNAKTDFATPDGQVKDL
jgi:hypothetical protein